MKYLKTNSNPFYNGLRPLVNEYFELNEISSKGNWQLGVKVLLLIAVYLSAYLSIFQFAATPWQFTTAYIIMGFSGVMIVFNLVHDASHKAIFVSKEANKIASLFGDLIGINTYIWNIRHNIQHHTFTNVLGGDLIIEAIPLIRLSPHQPYKPHHRYQVLYAPILYLFYSFYWILVIDIKLFFMKNICNLQNLRHPTYAWLFLIVSKIFYIVYMILIPHIYTQMTLLTALGNFIIMHMAAGILLSFVAVLGHFVDGPSFPETSDGEIDNSWSEHELEATIDFAPKSKIINWITGGLNTHVAHHLFPSICHIHYYKLTEIIEDYCYANNYTYRKESLMGAIRSHFRYLKRLSLP
jgi:linoleoyl-CoA desaturase